MSFFEENIFKKTFNPVKRIEAGSNIKEIPPKYEIGETEEFEVERTEEKDKYNRLRKKLELQKKGDTDFHFTQFDVYKLSDKALDLLKDYEMYRLKENRLAGFRSTILQDSDDFQFAAMLEHWLIKRNTETELLKKRAEQKFFELKKNPHITAYVNNMGWDVLQRADLKMILDPDFSKFENYQDKIKRYFKNVAEENKDKEGEEFIKEIANNPRYNCYCVISNLAQRNPISPQEIFKY